jgi:hypothetical protein
MSGWWADKFIENYAILIVDNSTTKFDFKIRLQNRAGLRSARQFQNYFLTAVGNEGWVPEKDLSKCPSPS